MIEPYAWPPQTAECPNTGFPLPVVLQTLPSLPANTRNVFASFIE